MTRQGLLTPCPTGAGIELRRWPDLVTVWSLDLTDMSVDDGGWEEVTSSHHAVVVLWTDHRRLDVLA